MGVMYLLYETASGFGLFERTKSEEIGVELPEVQKCVTDLARFSKIMKFKSFLPFKSAEGALENCMAISEGEVTPYLVNWLEQTIPKTKKSGKVNKFVLGVVDPKVGNAISETMGFKCKSNELVRELLRGIRLHFVHFIKALKSGDLQQAQLGLGHAYSRSKVKFNVHRVDNMIIQSIALLDQLDKDLNTFAMRVKEWYGWHFPELFPLINEYTQFCRLVKLIGNKGTLSENKLGEIEEIVMDADKARQVLEASRMSMGTDISPIDLANIESFATRVIALQNYRKELYTYLSDKMNLCAPNLSALIGEIVGARLIAHAGSLTSLAKYPASTVQILGAEKALFRALKTKGNTPKYGLIFHSSFIGRAGTKNKGRISRYLANKCSLASRIDSFAEEPTNVYGQKLKQQVEERLEFYKTGAPPRKNIDVMREAVSEAQTAMADDDSEGAASEEGDKDKKKKAKKAKKSKRKAEAEPEAAPEPDAKKAKKKKKKSKKSKKE